jgi:1-acyl-sn-glycerol-3-phosphate acyltransferase
MWYAASGVTDRKHRWFGPAGFWRWVVRGLVRFYYARIEIEGAERLPSDGPLLLAANHPNSLIDPVILGIAVRRPVRLLAKAPLFELPVFGSLMRATGMIPAYRGEDDPRAVRRNLESLARAARTLAEEAAVVGIFPEGRTHDSRHLAKLKSGAARLASQALDQGACGLRVVTIGLNYERKERFRSAVWVRVGEPIDPALVMAAHGGDERAAMRTLTGEIERRLRADLIHLDDPAWEGLLDDVEWLLPRQSNRAVAGLAALRSRKQAADALNYFHGADPDRAREAAARVSAHAEALRLVGLTADARLLRESGWALGWRLLRDGLAAVLGAAWAIFGLVVHGPPIGLARMAAAVFGRSDRSTLAVWRLLVGGALLLGWYAVLGLAAVLYFQPWVVAVLAVAVPWAGLYGFGWLRTQRRRLHEWWAECRLLVDRRRSAALRTEHEAIADMLRTFAAEWGNHPNARPSGVGPGAPPARRLRLVRPPAWVGAAMAAAIAGLVMVGAFWVWHDHPLEWRRTDAPALSSLPRARLEAGLDQDERALAGLVDGLEALRARRRAFEADLQDGRRSYYDPSDDEEIRRQLSTFLALRGLALRLAWSYERHGQLDPGPTRTRAARLHAAALILSYDMASRFVEAFAGNEEARRKLNESDARWDVPAGTYDAMQAALAHRGYRRLLQRAQEVAAAPEPEDEPPAVTAAVAESVARLHSPDSGWLHYKLASRAVALREMAVAGLYRARSGISTLVGDARLRAPRQGKALISPAQVDELRTRLEPGDILVERRNWYLSNAFLPGYWPHAALYVGRIDEIRALGLESDARVRGCLEAFGRPDRHDHALAVIEAVSEGVIFTSLEHSVGEADGVVVLRPRVNAAARREIIARAFALVGTPYDFDFDFFSGDKLVCTEVIHRATDGHVHFPLRDIYGRRTLPAMDIVRHALSEAGQSELAFVALLDGDERRGGAVWGDVAVLAESLERPALTWLQPRRP